MKRPNRWVRDWMKFGTTNYLYDGPNVFQEIDNAGNTLATYTQGGIDEPFAELRAMAASYYEQDFIGSVTSLSNGAGALANTYTYDSFGNLTASSGSLSNPLRYTAREFDPETSLYFYRARYLDPSTGRFISEDPIRFDGGNDFYTYVHDNPVLFRDPTGLCPSPLGVQCPCVKEAGLIRGIPLHVRLHLPGWPQVHLACEMSPHGSLRQQGLSSNIHYNSACGVCS